MNEGLPVFRATVTDPDAMSAALDNERPIGEVEVMAAVFDIPDTYIPVGETKRKVIDRGAFGVFINDLASQSRTTPWYLKHGDAHLTGYVDPALKLGFATGFAESGEGLVVRGSYNLRKEIARDAFSDLIHDPNGAQFSFRNDLSTEETYRGDDGFDHISTLGTGAVEEVSQVGVAAQQAARLLAVRGKGDLSEWGWTDEEVAALLDDERFMAAFSKAGQADADLRTRLVEAMTPEPDPIIEFYRALLRP